MTSHRLSLIRPLLIRAAMLAAIIAPTFTVTVITADRAEALQCSSKRMQATARGPTKSRVMRFARVIWSQKVERAMGPAWRVWNISAARRTVCRRLQVPQGSTHPYRWICQRSARPCLLAVE